MDVSMADMCSAQNEAVSLTLLGHINEVKKVDSQRIFIDIPIGLGDQFNTRTIDFELRKLLSKKEKAVLHPQLEKH